MQAENNPFEHNEVCQINALSRYLDNMENFVFYVEEDEYNIDTPCGADLY